MFLGSHLIVAVSVVFFLGVVVTYAVSVSTGHIKPVWCFISYTGNLPVESCIFSAVLNVCSALYFVVVVLRYSQVLSAIEKLEPYEKANRRLVRRNRVSLVVGLLGTLGLSVTGCFQQRNVHFMHMIGVFFCTCGTNAYLAFQTYFSFAVPSLGTRTSLKIFRLVIIVLSSGVLLTGAGLSLYFFATHPRLFAMIRVTSPGRRSNVLKVGTVLEWLLFFLIQFYIYSFYSDFKKIGLKRDQIIFLE